MSVSETGYDPIQVEEAIDDAYRFAEELDLGEYQEPLEEAITVNVTIKPSSETEWYTVTS